MIDLKLTLDSSEPLEDAMRVLGALYGVTLVVSNEDHDANKPASRTATAPGRKSANKPTVAKKAMNRKSASAKKAQPSAPSTKAAAARAEPKGARRTGGASSNAEVRSWARQNGFTVSDRGRLPATVVKAYRDAQSA